MLIDLVGRMYKNTHDWRSCKWPLQLSPLCFTFKFVLISATCTIKTEQSAVWFRDWGKNNKGMIYSCRPLFHRQNIHHYIKLRRNSCTRILTSSQSKCWTWNYYFFLLLFFLPKCIIIIHFQIRKSRWIHWFTFLRRGLYVL